MAGDGNPLLRHGLDDAQAAREVDRVRPLLHGLEALADALFLAGDEAVAAAGLDERRGRRGTDARQHVVHLQGEHVHAGLLGRDGLQLVVHMHLQELALALGPLQVVDAGPLVRHRMASPSLRDRQTFALLPVPRAPQRNSCGARSPTEERRRSSSGSSRRAGASGGVRHRRVELVARFRLLAAPDLAHLAPGAQEAAHRRHVVGHRAMQGLQVVAGHAREHVVFEMPVHAPVEELRQRVERDRAHAFAEIGHVVAQAAMHRHADEIAQPVRDIGAEGEQDRDDPQAVGDRHHGDERMDRQQQAGPVHGPGAGPRACRRRAPRASPAC